MRVSRFVRLASSERRALVDDRMRTLRELKRKRSARSEFEDQVDAMALAVLHKDEAVLNNASFVSDLLHMCSLPDPAAVEKAVRLLHEIPFEASELGKQPLEPLHVMQNLGLKRFAKVSVENKLDWKRIDELARFVNMRFNRDPADINFSEQQNVKRVYEWADKLFLQPSVQYSSAVFFNTDKSDVVRDAAIGIDLTEEQYRHCRALRLTDGSDIVMSDGRGFYCMAKFRKSTRLDVVEGAKFVPPPLQKIILCTALPQGDRTSFMVEKVAELGCDELRAVTFEFSLPSEVKPEKFERLTRLSAAASEQSRRVRVTNVRHETIPLTKLLEENVRGYFCDNYPPDPDAKPKRAYRTTEEKSGDRLQDAVFLRQASHVIVGPEAGFSMRERDAMRNTLRPLELSDNVLRIETASIMGVGMIGMEKFV